MRQGKGLPCEAGKIAEGNRKVLEKGWPSARGKAEKFSILHFPYISLHIFPGISGTIATAMIRAGVRIDCHAIVYHGVIMAE